MLSLLVTEMIRLRTKFFHDNPEGTLRALTDEEIEFMINNPSGPTDAGKDSKELLTKSNAKSELKPKHKAEMHTFPQAQASQDLKSSIVVNKRESTDIVNSPPQQTNEEKKNVQEENVDVSSPSLVQSDNCSSVNTDSKSVVHQEGTKSIVETISQEQRNEEIHGMLVGPDNVESSSRKRLQHPCSQNSSHPKRAKVDELKSNVIINPPIHNSSSDSSHNAIGTTSKNNDISSEKHYVDSQNYDNNTPPLLDTLDNNTQERACSPQIYEIDSDSSDDDILSPGPFRRKK